MARFSGLATPIKVQELQRTLYRKAKENPRWRAWSLYGDLCRRDILALALQAVVAKGGAAGIDGVTTEQVKAGAEVYLDNLQRELKERSYRPGPVKRIWIPKADGKQRPLGVPNVKDRIVQTGLLILMQPIFEADFDDGSYGYRPGRTAHQAMDAIRLQLRQGRTEVIDADLSGYFDTIDHARLLQLIARRISDGTVLRLIKLLLKAPIVEEKKGKRSYHKNDRGTPQGGVLSPLLANLYLNSLDHGVNDQPQLDAKLIRFADDFVLLCRPGQAAALLARLKRYLAAKRLTLNETKTRLLDSRQESFRFLGFSVAWRRSPRTGNAYVHVEPSPKARLSLRSAVRQELNHWTKHRSCAEAVRIVNRIVRGWSNYYHYGNCARVFARQSRWVRGRLRRWLWRKYDCAHGQFTFFTDDRLLGQYQLWPLPLTAPWTR
ncbi:MAG TPA: group II intron reverse transcriptase/maturase [Opitutaceae bacterium]|jgi:group II intron reverse transcriptase/maturase